ncbi:MAG TPA: hypothetical protein PK530_23315 [Anaerolineales bacterium]|nr:hypothetical protein [Anaerolineales bacterium]
MATVSSLENLYKSQIDFVHLDWDDPDSDPVIEHYQVLRRSTYILLAPDGTVLWQWVGPLDELAVEGEFKKALEMYPTP